MSSLVIQSTTPSPTPSTTPVTTATGTNDPPTVGITLQVNPDSTLHGGLGLPSKYTDSWFRSVLGSPASAPPLSSPTHLSEVESISSCCEHEQDLDGMMTPNSQLHTTNPNVVSPAASTNSMTSTIGVSPSATPIATTNSTSNSIATSTPASTIISTTTTATKPTSIQIPPAKSHRVNGSTSSNSSLIPTTSTTSVPTAPARSRHLSSSNHPGGQPVLRRNKLHGSTRKFEQDYTLLTDCLLGSGASGSVYVCTSKRNPTHEYAVKIIKTDQTQIDLEKMGEELKILSTIKHRNIIRLKDVYTTGNTVYIVTELAYGGELFDRILKVHSFCEKDVVNLTRSLFQAVAYLHSRGIVHRDLKPENILFSTPDQDSDIKISDFGFARDLLKPSRNLRAKTQTGSFGYMAPEIFSGRLYDEKADVWSLGIIVYIMLCGLPPYVSVEDTQGRCEPFWIYTNAMISGATKPVSFPDEQGWKHVSSQAKHFLASVLELDPQKRMRSIDALNHPWLKKSRGVGNAGSVSVHHSNQSISGLSGLGSGSNSKSHAHPHLNRQYLTFTLNKRFDLNKLKEEMGHDQDQEEDSSTTTASGAAPTQPDPNGERPASPSQTDDSSAHPPPLHSFTPDIQHVSTPPPIARYTSHDPSGQLSPNFALNTPLTTTAAESLDANEQFSFSYEPASTAAATSGPPLSIPTVFTLQDPTLHSRDPSAASSTVSDSLTDPSASAASSTGHSRDSSSVSTTPSSSSFLARKARMQHYKTLPAQYTNDLDEEEDEDGGHGADGDHEAHSSEEETGP